MYILSRGDDTAAPREIDDMAAAMTAAGYPEPAEWFIATAVPDQIHTHWGREMQHGDAALADADDTSHLRRYWFITGPDAAHDLVDLLPAEQIRARDWSGLDRKVIHDSMIELSWPQECARACAGRLAAHVAVGVSLTHDRIIDAIRWAYAGADTLPEAEIINGAVRAGNALGAAGITIVRPAEVSALTTTDIVSTMRRPFLRA